MGLVLKTLAGSGPPCLWLVLVVLSMLSMPGGLVAAENQDNRWAQSFFFENDLFSDSDSNYTNGIKYSLISPDLSPHANRGHLPRKVLGLVHKIPFIRDSSPEYIHKAEFSIGQNMYTPVDTSRSDLIEDDRPYAGWFYLGFAYHRKTEFEDHLDFLDTVEIQVGMVGPLSFAEESQTLVHELRDINTAKGWDNQLKNEPGLLVAFERKWLFSSDSDRLLTADTIVHTGGAIGNVATYLNTGLEVRYGMNPGRHFGISMIRPAGSVLFTPHKKPSIYLFGAVNGKYVLRDIFLDGNTFTDSHSIDKKDFVAEFAAGISLSHRNLMLTFTHVTRTEQFVGQEDEHHFGSLTLNFFYPLW